MRRLVYGLAFVYACAVSAAEGRATPDGKAVYVKTCAACHALGIAGAPKLSDRPAWRERLAGGRDALVVSVLRGKNAMPPKGGNASISDADARAALDYMLKQLED